MDITTVAGASAFQQLQTSNQVATAVAVKSADADRQAGADVERLIAAAVTGVGGHVDVMA